MTTVMRQRLAAHRHLDAVADALRAVPRSRPFDSLGRARAIRVPTVIVASRDDADPTHPLATARLWADAIPGAASGRRGAGPVAAGLAGRSALAVGGRLVGGSAGRVSTYHHSECPIPHPA